MMRHIIAVALCLTSLSTPAAKVAKLDMLPGEYDATQGHLLFSTQAIPNKASAVVHCVVRFPWPYTGLGEEYIYVMPKKGKFGKIENTYVVENFKGIEVLQEFTDSRIVSHYNDPSFDFSIRNVRKEHETIIIDVNHVPVGTAASCWF